MQFQPRPSLYHIVLLFLAASLAGCASGAKIQSDYDHDADFGSYTTYNFMEGAGPEQDNYQSFFSQYMVEAITIEMENRGYAKSDNPDLLVNFNGILREKTQVRTSPAPMSGGYYGYRGGYYDPWGGYGYATETHVSEYTEGTFNIDLVDSKQRKLIWEAVGKGRVSQKDLENLHEGVMKGVPRFFAHYPFQAGDPNPVATDTK